MANVVIIGTGTLTNAFIDAVSASHHSLKLVVIPDQSIAPIGDSCIDQQARTLNIPVFESSCINDDRTLQIISRSLPDVILSTWHKLIQPPLLSLPKYGVIGTHPTLLPLCRGRHPLHWLIALGHKSSALSYFLMDANIDSGNILAQHAYSINASDLSGVHETVNSVGRKTVVQCIDSVLREFTGYTQDASANATYLRARTSHDTLLDPRLSTMVVDRLVRSYTSPFPCAQLMTGVGSLSITGTKDVSHVYDNMHFFPYGKIYSVSAASIDLGFYDGILRLYVAGHSLAILQNIKESYIHPPSFYS